MVQVLLLLLRQRRTVVGAVARAVSVAARESALRELRIHRLLTPLAPPPAAVALAAIGGRTRPTRAFPLPVALRNLNRNRKAAVEAGGRLAEARRHHTFARVHIARCDRLEHVRVQVHVGLHAVCASARRALHAAAAAAGGHAIRRVLFVHSRSRIALAVRRSRATQVPRLVQRHLVLQEQYIDTLLRIY